jgi:MFS transporter, DHA2 family, multidrug resistance protein
MLMIGRFVHDPPHMRGSKSIGFDSIGLGTLVVWTGCLQIILDKGQEDDWFGAIWIRWAALLLVVSFGWFVWHSWQRALQPDAQHWRLDRNLAHRYALDPAQQCPSE